MPKFTDDTLVQRARRFAILDRESLREAYGDHGPEAERIKREIDGLVVLAGRNLDEMTQPEYQLACLALVYGEQWEQSLADASPGSQVRARCLRNVKLFQAVRHRRWGRTKLEAFLAEATAVPITELFSPKTRS